MMIIIEVPYNLKVNFAEKPVGIDLKKPFFSWNLRSLKNNVKQVSYRIIVSDSIDKINKNIGDCWDTNMVKSEENAFIYYNGQDLKSSTRYYWRVKWWDNEGNESDFSNVSYFETAYLDFDLWKGKWVYVDGIARKEFNLEKYVKNARIYISGLGYYELHINGKRIGKKVLTPQWTDYSKKVLYSTYDVSNSLLKGNNCIGVVVGNSRYTEEYGYDGKHQIIIDLIIEFVDEEKVIYRSDESWKTTKGPISYDDIYNGETYDARLEENEWDMPTYNDSKWKNCTFSKSQLGKLVSDSLYPSIEVVADMRPKTLTYVGSNRYIIDFGQNFTGWIRLNLTGHNNGDKIKIRYAELIDENMNLNTGPNRTAKNEDTYICNGNDIEIFEAHFTYHGFRYVEITGINMVLTQDTITGRVVHSNVKPTGSLTFDKKNNLLNDIHRIILWSQVSNLMGIPTDCPQRDERMGWLGDSSLVAEESIMNFDMYNFYKKWIDDIKDSQLEDGEIPDVVPPFWPLYPADPGWGDEFITIVWEMYRYYGDYEMLNNYYPYIKKWVNFLLQKMENGILKYYKYGDWCPPKMVRPLDTPGELYSTAIMYKDLDMMCNISRILLNDDYKIYGGQMESIRHAFNKKFLVEREQKFPEFLNKNRYGIKEAFDVTYYGDESGGSQTSQILPLYFNIAPDDKKEKVFKYLLNDIVINCSNHLNTGIFGTRFLFQVLSAFGRSDIALKVILQKSYPGWGYMIKEGATTLWERWELLSGGPEDESDKNIAESGMNSHNHIMFGSVDNWFYDTVAGINPDDKKPGLKKIILKPHILQEIDNFHVAFMSIRGPINYGIENEDKNIKVMTINIPANTGFLLQLDPEEVLEIISINEDSIDKWDKNKINDRNNTFEFGSGLYRIKMKLR